METDPRVATCNDGLIQDDVPIKRCGRRRRHRIKMVERIEHTPNVLGGIEIPLSQHGWLSTARISDGQLQLRFAIEGEIGNKGLRIF